MKYCNIIFETELVNHKELEYINYYNSIIKYSEIENNLPTLYVGWLFLKKCNIFNADILKNSIIDNKLYWTPSFEENKSLHVNGVVSFTNLAPIIYLTSNYNYIDVDPVMCQLYCNDDITNFIGNSFEKSYQYKNDIIYLLNNNIIYGLNLKMFEFFNFNVSQLLDNINNSTNIVITDPNGDIYIEHLKKQPDFKFLKRFIVALL